MLSKFFSILLFSIIVFNGIAGFAGFVLAGTVATGGNCTTTADCASPNECLCAPCGTCGPSMGNVVICSPTKWCSIDALAESVGNWLFYI
ncbi:hypothetical protein KKA09_00425, partial [Patescibacteria group bacterium]|nr:hypothetical protein [Patescibacteria group bacterium]